MQDAKQLQKDCEFAIGEIRGDVISPNILLHVLSLDQRVHAELMFGGVDLKLLEYLLNPYRIRGAKKLKTSLSSETKEIVAKYQKGDTYLDMFHHSLEYRYVRDILAKAGYQHRVTDDSILSKYATLIDGGNPKAGEKIHYEKVRKLLGKKNIMIMGAIGSGRYDFIKDVATYYKDDISIYYFDFFKYLRLEQDRVFGILHGLFAELGVNYVYIPNFLQVMQWVKALKLDSIMVLLDELSGKNKIITKINQNNFDVKEFRDSELHGFYSVHVPKLTLEQLEERLNIESLTYEKFYAIGISKSEIRNVIKQSNFEEDKLDQPGKSLKYLMHLAMTKYGQDGLLLEKPKRKNTPIDEQSIYEYLTKSIIGQTEPLKELASSAAKVNFLEGGVLKTFFFQGEVGCGKLKSAIELSKLLFGDGSLVYMDMSIYEVYPFKLKIFEAVDDMLSRMYGGIIFLDNIESIDTSEIDILSYIKGKIADLNIDGIMAPVFIIASSQLPVSESSDYSYVIEHFDSIIYFNKLTVRDLEKIAQIQINKIHDVIPKDAQLNAFVISANANVSLNALGVKKIISSMLSL